MTYKEFRKWCNERAGDGCWGMVIALSFINFMSEVEKVRFWKREKYFQTKNKEYQIEKIIKELDEKRMKLYGNI